MLVRVATASAALLLGVLVLGVAPSWAGMRGGMPGGGMPEDLQGNTDLPWGTTLREAPSGNTSQSRFSPSNLQIPRQYCSRMPQLPGRAPTECVPGR
jgi:hypothetical protein